MFSGELISKQRQITTFTLLQRRFLHWTEKGKGTVLAPAFESLDLSLPINHLITSRLPTTTSLLLLILTNNT
jgi:hypothetical protein